jgi:hypothetical protein
MFALSAHNNLSVLSFFLAEIMRVTVTPAWNPQLACEQRLHRNVNGPQRSLNCSTSVDSTSTLNILNALVCQHDWLK